MPHDTTTVPLREREAFAALDDLLTPPAIPCVINGQDARRCPDCGRVFRMKESFAGKMIRCRGCKVTFRVRASKPTLAEPARPAVAPVQSNEAAAPTGPLYAPHPPAAPAQQRAPPPTIFEDVGDMLDELLQGEQVPSVVRPRNAPRRSPTPSNTFPAMIAVVFGGVCALPATAWILATFFPDRCREILKSLPDTIRSWLQ
ncbi:MAG: hypothetical protein ACKOEM_04140 [Planctomycetia bacterium]